MGVPRPIKKHHFNSVQLIKSAASVQERLIFEKYFFALIFAAINQERLLIKSDLYWRGYGTFIQED